MPVCSKKLLLKNGESWSVVFAHFTFAKQLFGSQHAHSSKTRFNVTLGNTKQIDINNVRIRVIS